MSLSFREHTPLSEQFIPPFSGFFKKRFLFLSNFDTQHEAQNHRPEIKSHKLHRLSQPGALTLPFSGLKKHERVQLVTIGFSSFFAFLWSVYKKKMTGLLSCGMNPSEALQEVKRRMSYYFSDKSDREGKRQGRS